MRCDSAATYKIRGKVRCALSWSHL